MPGRSPSRTSFRTGACSPGAGAGWRAARSSASSRFLTVAMFDTDPYDPPRAAVHNPMAGVHHPGWLDWIWVPFWIGTLASLFAGAVAIRLRLRRSSGVERLQTLWIAWAAILIPLGLLTCFAGWGIGVPFADAALFVILMLDADRTGRLRRHRGHPLPALRDRAPRQPHRGLRHADPAARGDLHRDHARRGRRRRPWLRLGDGRRDARRRALVPAPARARAGHRRPPLRPCPLGRAASGAGVRERRARGHPRARGDRRRARAGAARSPGGARVLAARERDVCDLVG